MRTGTSVMPRRAAKPIANVFVNARGLNSRPSGPAREKTGTKLTVMTRSEKKRGRPTLRAAPMMTSVRSDRDGSLPCSTRKCSSCLCGRSRSLMIAASTVAPMAMPMPPSDMMFEVSPSQYIGRNERRIATGSVMMATSDERTCHRKMRHTSATTTHSSISFSLSVAMEALISSLRS